MEPGGAQIRYPNGSEQVKVRRRKRDETFCLKRGVSMLMSGYQGSGSVPGQISSHSVTAAFDRRHRFN